MKTKKRKRWRRQQQLKSKDNHIHNCLLCTTLRCLVVLFLSSKVMGIDKIHHLLKFEKNKSKEKYHLFSQNNTSLKFVSKKFYNLYFLIQFPNLTQLWNSEPLLQIPSLPGTEVPTSSQLRPLVTFGDLFDCHIDLHTKLTPVYSLTPISPRCTSTDAFSITLRTARVLNQNNILEIMVEQAPVCRGVDLENKSKQKIIVPKDRSEING